MLTIYGRRNSGNVQKVMWLIGELALAHEHVPLGGSFGGLDDPNFLRLNPHGRVPVIDDDGVVVWESHAILRYLAAQHGAPEFWATTPAERSHVDRWMDWSHTRWQVDFIDGVFWGFYRTPEPQRNHAAIEAAIEACARDVMMLDRELAARPFVAGYALSLADIAIGSLMYRYFTLDIRRPVAPNVEAWYERLVERPAYREHVMVAYHELRGRLSF